MDKCSKNNRILMIYSRLVNGELINKRKMAEICKVSEKAIQRDIEDIRGYLYENRNMEINKGVKYCRIRKGYFLQSNDNLLTSRELLVIIKILLESRAFSKGEMGYLLESLLGNLSKDERKTLEYIIGNERINYSQLSHGSKLISKIWDLSVYIKSQEITDIIYTRADKFQVKRRVKPVSIMFSEYYFYLIAYFQDHEYPAIFRIDRIEDYKSLEERFYIPYRERFEDGEFRKRIQFMHSGELIRTRFEFSKGTLEAVLDRLPTANIIKEEGGIYTIEAEVFGDGIIMWFLSQGSKVKVLQPESLVDRLREEVEKMREIYK